MKPVCLVMGAGAGIGGSVAKKFAGEGYHAVLCRRTDEAGLQKLVGDIQADGGDATGFLLNAVNENTIEEHIVRIEKEIGPVEVVLFNLGAQIGNRSLEDTSHKAFELGWRMATFALFRMAKVLLPIMEQRGSGAFLVTSATAAIRGNAGQHSHAAAMGGRRMLCQTLNAEYAPKGDTRRAHIGRRRRRRPRHARQDVGRRSFSKTSRKNAVWKRTDCCCPKRWRKHISTSPTNIALPGPTNWTSAPFPI